MKNNLAGVEDHSCVSSMIGRRWHRLMTCWLVLIAIWMMEPCVRAHTPFGSSIQVLLGRQIEVNIGMGTSGSDAFLKAIGHSELILTNQIYAQKPGSGLRLSPIDLAPQLFEISHAGSDLKKSVTQISSDKQGVLYCITFQPSSPVAGELELTANFLKTVSNFEQCPLVVLDEQGNEVATAIVSISNPTIKVVAPELKSAAVLASKPGAETKLEATNAEIAVTNPAGLVSASIKKTSSVEPQNVSQPKSIPHPSFGQFFRLGVEHILTGTDHLLFLCALLLCLRRLRPMLWVITCFTLAHSITLALSALDLVSIPSRIIEPLIAVSIIAVAVENLVRDRSADRLWLAGIFGLIHGFGFASALRETGLGRTGAEIAMPLLAFNLGVETGQLAVAAVVIPVLILLRKHALFARHGVAIASVVIILISTYWLVERIAFYY